LPQERATYDLGRHHAFHSMGREKINLINVFATMGFHLLLSDVDTVWQRDPLPYFDRFPAADILSSSDVTQPTHENYAEDQGLEEPSAVRLLRERQRADRATAEETGLSLAKAGVERTNPDSPSPITMNALERLDSPHTARWCNQRLGRSPSCERGTAARGHACGSVLAGGASPRVGNSPHGASVGVARRWHRVTRR
jgi:hypothetical protein